MHSARIHRALSDDGTEIAARVHGRGPSLVLVNSGLSDGDQWRDLVGYLEERFTCHLLSTRGRGASALSPDVRPQRLVEDIRAFTDSLGEPVGLIGLSTTWLFGAAANSEVVAAVAAYEPAVPEVLAGDEAATIEAMYERFESAAAEGRLADAARHLFEAVANEEEFASLPAEHIELAAATVPLHLQEMEQGDDERHPSPTDPKVLEQISVPTLLLYGSRTALASWMPASVRYLADHLASADVRELDGLGHLAPFVAPQVVAEELAGFFEETRRLTITGQ